MQVGAVHSFQNDRRPQKDIDVCHIQGNCCGDRILVWNRLIPMSARSHEDSPSRRQTTKSHAGAKAHCLPHCAGDARGDGGPDHGRTNHHVQHDVQAEGHCSHHTPATVSQARLHAKERPPAKDHTAKCHTKVLHPPANDHEEAGASGARRHTTAVHGRDRLHTRSHAEARMERPGHRALGPAGPIPVSYTHLTLPTICSV